ncbi:DUF6484 domain-containing protein [Sphaerotilus uruguayifluvii]|uniref:DUF6484 domain-containing protein n=1 Tax=Sphaerotilus uruguayifluvii TaxID=2735897 RepID=A0ABX2G3M2_9BURK|nr:DUF6484 domain-containing protein [Leptothrix sp. C29]NRT56639.1 hypothetical protein [Leptothrix sp. C29]
MSAVDTAEIDAVQEAASPPLQGVWVGELLAVAPDEDMTALVLMPAVRSGAVLRARSTVDLHGAHIGHQVVVMFEQGDADRPIVMGVIRGRPGWPLPTPPAQVEVDADGDRMVVQAREQLVLRCGKASITLTKAGKVLIQGAYVSSRSSGVNRIKGGSVQLN